MIGCQRLHSRRAFLRLLGSVAVSVSAGCTFGAAGRSPASPEPVQLVYQDWRTDWFPPMARRMLDQFHDMYPHIRVFFTPDPPNLRVKMVADMQAGTAADLFQGCCTHFPAWAQLGFVLDLRQYAHEDLDQATIDEWDPAQYRALTTPDAMRFGLPKYHGALALYFNKDLFDAYGVGYPDGTWDHDSYREAMTNVTNDRNGDDQTDLWGSLLDVTWDRIQVHVNGWGGHVVDPSDQEVPRMCEDRALAALEWIRAQMWDDGVMARPADVLYLSTREAFVGERVAMVEDGSWALKDILTAAKFRVGVAPFPAGPLRRVTLSTSDGFGIYAGTKHPDEAWELMKFLISEDYGRAMSQANLLQPARASLVAEWGEFVSRAFPGMIEPHDIAAFADGHVRGYSVTAEVFADMASVRPIVDRAWEEILVLGEAPVERMHDACREIERVGA